MFLNTTLYLVGHETVKRQGNKNGRNRQPVKICLRQSHNSQQNKFITFFGILKLLCATRVKLFVQFWFHDHVGREEHLINKTVKFTWAFVKDLYFS